MGRPAACVRLTVLVGGLLAGNGVACSGGGDPGSGGGEGGGGGRSSGGASGQMATGGQGASVGGQSGGGGGQSGSGAGQSGSGGTVTGGMPVKPVLMQIQIDLDTAFDLPPPGTVDEKIRTQGPLVAAGDVPPGHGGAVEPSLLLQFLKRDAVVRAGVSGKVVNIGDQTAETCDSELHIIPDGQDERDPEWVVSYDHVKNPTVTVGQHVSAGDPLGNPGSLFFGCDGPGRVELQINHQPTGLAHCPLSFLAPTTRATVEASLRDLMTRWNTAVGQPIYDQAHLTAAGCMTETSKP